MHWNIDNRTAEAATAHRISIQRDTPARQFEGCLTSPETWNDRVVQPAKWPDGFLWSSPEQILKFFGEGRYTQGLAMVVSWGGMGRRSGDIYRDRNPEFIERIERTLRDCAHSIETSQSISESWQALTGWSDSQLGWSAVMASKTLHFLCRSLGFDEDPPAAIDNKVMRKRVWPVFRDSIPTNERPGNWEGDTFDAYSRYMTAILTWAANKHWTTKELEATVFDQYMNNAEPRCSIGT